MLHNLFSFFFSVDRFVHSTCDSEADLSVYHEKKQNNPDYDYICPPCKTLIQSGRISHSVANSGRNSANFDEDNMSVSQDSTCAEDGENTGGGGSTETLEKNSDYGLGKGKPYLAIKVAAKKRMGGLSFSGIGSGSGNIGGGGRGKGNKLPFQKRSRLSEFGRKRGPKAKIRGVFNIPGLELQRPTGANGSGDATGTSSNKDDEPGIENRLVLCSAKDKFILTQDICVMCGAIGTDYEGCLIACTQCGQCYHPYCVNVKVTKVILQKGWRCLDCTVCEGCGQKNDEARLILCDECDISYHIYCMEPPLEHVPQGNWKCKWCAVCHKCGKNTPGKNCQWKNSYSECGPCASQSSCAICSESYSEGELIIQCHNCERWLHSKCDSIKNEEEAEKCDEMGYNCILCRPKDQLPPHLMLQQQQAAAARKASLLSSNSSNASTSQAVAAGTGKLTPKQEECNDDLVSVSLSLEGTHYIDGVCLSENGLNMIKSLQMEYIRRKRKQKFSNDNTNASGNKDAGILAAIESVVAGGGTGETVSDDVMKVVEPLDPKEEAEIYKDGMIWERADASPPEGFALCTNEQGVVVLRKKRQRNLQKLGIGGFNVRNRAFKKDGGGGFFRDANDTTTSIQDGGDNVENTGISFSESYPPSAEKKRKPLRKKQKNKLSETYPSYLQEAFFGKNLLDTNKVEFESDTSGDEARSNVSDDKCIKLSQEELKMLDQMKNEQQQHQKTSLLTSVTTSSVTVAQQQQAMTITGGSGGVNALSTTGPVMVATTSTPITSATVAVQIQKEQHKHPQQRQQIITQSHYNDGYSTNNVPGTGTGLGIVSDTAVATSVETAVVTAQGNGSIITPTPPSSYTPTNQLSDETDALKDIISNDLIDSDFVNSIINDGDDLSKHSGKFFNSDFCDFYLNINVFIFFPLFRFFRY